MTNAGAKQLQVALDAGTETAFAMACNPENVTAVLAELAASQAEVLRLRTAIFEGARRVENLKRECGTDPESATAIQNGRYMSISYFLRAALTEGS